MKTKNIIFNGNKVRIVHGEYTPKNDETVLINPEYPKGISPSHWKLQDNQIIEMTEEEKQETNNNHLLLKKEYLLNKVKKVEKKHYLRIILISSFVSLLFNVLFKLFFN